MAKTVTDALRFRGRVASRVEALHDQATELLTALDRGGSFREDRWDRPGGGGGVSRMLADGATFEKAGVNRSVVEGVLSPQLAQRIGAHTTASEPSRFFVTGLSLVVHPRSPMVPTVHLNVRYFEITGPLGEPTSRQPIRSGRTHLTFTELSRSHAPTTTLPFMLASRPGAITTS